MSDLRWTVLSLTVGETKVCLTFGRDTYFMEGTVNEKKDPNQDDLPGLTPDPRYCRTCQCRCVRKVVVCVSS